MKRYIYIMILICATLLATLQKMNAQEMKITTGHPDFSVKLLRCSSSGSTLTMVLQITNMSYEDVEEIYAYGGGWNGRTAIYDNLGNIYDENNVQIKLANESGFTDTDQRTKFVSRLPMKVTYKITGFSPRATSIALFEPHFRINYWNIDAGSVKIRYIPIK